MSSKNPPDCDRVYTLGEDPPFVPDGYRLVLCDADGSRRLIRWTAEQQAAGDARRAWGYKRQAEMNREMFAGWGHPPRLVEVMCAATDRSAAEAREQAKRSKVRATQATSAAWRARQQRPVLTASRERRPAATRRASSSSSTSSSDPGDPDADAEPPGGLRPIGEPLAAELARIADRLRARGGVG